MVDCMKAGKSVLDPQTKFPEGAVYFPFENYVPGGANGAYMNWYRAILIDGKRLAPPKTFQDTLGVIAVVRTITGTNNFEIYELHNYHDLIVAFYQSKGHEVVVTKQNVFVNNLSYPLPSKRFRVGFTAKKNIPYAAYSEDGKLRLYDLGNQKEIRVDAEAEDIMACGGRIYTKVGREICEVAIFEGGSGIMGAGVQRAATVLEHAVEMYQGVAIQQMFGTFYVELFPHSMDHRQLKVPELNGYKIVDAKCEANVLMVVAAKNGKYDRLIFRFNEVWDNYDLRVVEDVSHVDINFTVLENGVVLCLTEEEKLEMFAAKTGSTAIKIIEDPILKSDMRLCHAKKALLAQGNRMFSFTLRS